MIYEGTGGLQNIEGPEVVIAHSSPQSFQCQTFTIVHISLIPNSVRSVLNYGCKLEDRTLPSRDRREGYD